jgi:hypothetical protein
MDSEKGHVRWRWIGVALVVMCGSVTAHAQTATATLSGSIIDESGAVVPDAQVTIQNLATGLQRRTVTGREGSFVFPLLPPGHYSVVTLKEGFAPAEIKDSVLNVGDTVSITIRLMVAKVGESVEVVAAHSPVNTSPAVSTVIDQQFIANQPLNGRSLQSLVGLSPGVVFTPTNVTNPGQFSVNGQRTGTNYFMIDGVSANFGTTAAATLYDSAGGGQPAFSGLGTTNTLVAVDALQEFSIQTSTYAPEFGRQPGAQVSLVTRSGTNQLHGSVFEYLRNDRFDANDYFANRTGLRKAPLRQNDFGGVLGGPLKQNRAFFFLSYEGLRLRQPTTSSPILVPSLSARERAPETIRPILNAFPLPTERSPSGNPDEGRFLIAYSDNSKLDASSVRIDWALGRATLFGRFNYASARTFKRADFCTANCLGESPATTWTTTLGTTILPRDRVTLDLRLNYSLARTTSRYKIDDLGGARVPDPSLLYPPDSSEDGSLFYLLLDSAGGGIASGFNVANQQRQLNAVATLSWLKGSHQIRVGADYRGLFPIHRGPRYRRFYLYDSVSQMISDTVPLLVIVAGDPELRPIYHNTSAFAQDTWRATSRLTMTYGVRYEVNPSPDEANGRLPLTVESLDARPLVLAPPGTRLYRTTYGNVAPRAGVAYQLTSGTSIRGGVGLFYDLGYTFTGSAFSTSNYPFSSAAFLANVPFGSPPTWTPPPPVSLTPPYGRLFAYTSPYRLPYTAQYNATVEQRVGEVTSVSVGYVGALGRRLGRVESLRNPTPEVQRVDVVSNNGRSSYHALQAQIRRRLSRGLQALVSYTWAKSQDTVSDESILNFQAPSSRYDPDVDIGPSTFDVRHAFNGAVSYDVPDGVGGRALRAVLGRLGLDAIVRARSALPVTVLTGRDPSGFGLTSVTRPDIVGREPMYVDDPSVAGGRRFNPAAFRVPPSGRQGTLGRNVLRGFPAWQLDMSLRRRLELRRGLNLHVRVDAFNVLNHPNFANPIGVMTDPNFGISTQMLGRSLGGLSALYQVGGPRSMQLSLKLEF